MTNDFTIIDLLLQWDYQNSKPMKELKRPIYVTPRIYIQDVLTPDAIVGPSVLLSYLPLELTFQKSEISENKNKIQYYIPLEPAFKRTWVRLTCIKRCDRSIMDSNLLRVTKSQKLVQSWTTLKLWSSPSRLL